MKIKNYVSPVTLELEMEVGQIMAASPIVESDGLTLGLNGYSDETEW